MFFSFPVPDRCVPESLSEVKKVVLELIEIIQNGLSIAIHCRQGIGRSSLLAASVLIGLGLSTSEAFIRIELARGCHVPDTEEQRSWVSSFEEFY